MANSVLPLHNWLLLNTQELSGLIGFPIGQSFVFGLDLGTSRQLPPSPSAPRRGGLVLARSTYPGADHTIRMTPDSRLVHTWLIGPTGTGKSTLIANMALQDAAAGHGFVVIDPKTQLVADILARLPEERHGDVVVLDPAAAYMAPDQPLVGFNVLGHARTEHERELATDQIVHILHSLWADSWGPRTSDVLRNAILTLTHTRGRDGSAFTLAEIGPLLEDEPFRRFVTAQAAVPAEVQGFWRSYDRFSDAQRLQVIGPSLNKLRAFTTRTPLRLTLGQSQGIDIGELISRGKILLVPLSKGVVGTETAQLFGSLVVSSLVNAIFARAVLSAEHRRPVYVYLDEWQDILRLPLDLADALSQARGMGAGFVLANQYVEQLPDVAKRAVLGTVRSAIAFRLQDHADAKLLERRFAPLTATELLHLPAFEIAAQLDEPNASSRTVTGKTLPLPDAGADGSALARISAERFGLPRSEIEAGIRSRIAPTDRGTQKTSGATSFGRRKVGGGQ